MANSPIIYGPNGATSLVSGGINLPGSTSGTLQIQPAASTTSYEITMPSAQATGLLQNDGAGNLSWNSNSPVSLSLMNSTDWVSYTPAFTGLGTVTSINIKSRRNGSNLEIMGTFTIGTPTATTANMTVGFAGTSGGITIDTSTAPVGTVIGSAGTSSAPNTSFFELAPLSATAGIAFGAQGPSGSVITAANGNGIFASSSFVSLSVVVPISTWTANTTVITGLAATGGFVSPTITKLLSGSSSYSPPSGVTYIEVEMIAGGGGGGAGGSTGGSAGGTGGTTSFGTSLLTATGGLGGTFGSNASGGGAGGIGGTATLNTPAIGISLSGNTGGSGNSSGIGLSSIGAASPFGGAGIANATTAGTTGNSASVNTGSGGSGGTGTSGSNFGGGGGGSGAYIKAIITSPLSSYNYAVGSAGTGGTGSTTLGGAGGSGMIIIREFYANGAIGTATTVTGNVAGSQITAPLASSIIQGTVAGGNATSGFVGEFISANPGSPVAVGSTGAFVTITSISLTAGDWDVEANLQISPGGTTAATEFTGALSLNATSLDSSSNGAVTQVLGTLAVSSISSYPVGKRRFNLSSTTTVFLVGELTYTVSGSATWPVNNLIQARRVR